MILHTLVTVYWMIVYVLLLSMLLILVVNLLTFPRLGNGMDIGYSPPRNSTQITDTPFISILVPARNEEHCIEACVRSLVGQMYEQLEVIVLDDNSSDNTSMIVQHIIDGLPERQAGRLRLLHGAELPKGWIGKNFACHQLACEARGDYLLFTDADTVTSPLC